ncbi:hypothetical protein [Nocardioides guangzhouensis]|uniref:hypothetical protein n=1 Tax=Nocardioides guangzhouensis TaxID=2497878 RepID=UPI0014383415|nr:hypothetical protein [Nocardioides guangzhouensis]
MTLAVLVGLVLLLTVLGRDPVGWVKARWYDVRGTTVPVDGVTARATPETGGPPAPNTLVVDADPATAWTITWKAKSPEPACGQGETQGVVVLRWGDPTRVRQLQVDAGLQEGQAERGLEFRPATIDVRYREAGGTGDRECRTLTLRDTADRQTLDLDTEVAVRSLRISVSSVFDSPTPEEDGPVSIRRIVVRSRPA